MNSIFDIILIEPKVDHISYQHTYSKRANAPGDRSHIAGFAHYILHIPCDLIALLSNANINDHCTFFDPVPLYF